MTASAPEPRSDESAGRAAPVRRRPAGLVAGAVLVVVAALILALVRKRAG